MTKAVILNDTREDFHHGCSRVMTVLEKGLTEHGMTITARSPLRHRWWEDQDFLGHMAQAERIVINGEGTLHHGRPAGLDLLKVVEHKACRAPTYLVNALYQENPDSWLAPLSSFSGVWVRDSRSAQELTDQGARCDDMIPDLTLCGGPIVDLPAKRSGTIVGDSVDNSVTAALKDHAQLSNAQYIPSLSHLKRPKGRTRLGRYLRNRYIARFEAQTQKEFPLLHLAKTVDDYATRLAHAELHVTGRFHGVCISLLTGTPFLALQSNSWKIEMLLEDLGLSKSRLIAIEDLNQPFNAADWAFSTDEQSRIAAALFEAQGKAAKMFAQIAAGA